MAFMQIVASELCERRSKLDIEVATKHSRHEWGKNETVRTFFGEELHGIAVDQRHLLSHLCNA
jgi:hypothetical protein